MSSLLLENVFCGIPEVERGKAFNIKAHPKEQKIIYGVSKSVVIRDINNPSNCVEVSHHAKKVTCAAYSPSGFYVCSGDISGKIKIWDTVNDDHIVKYEYQVIGGAINDIQWSPDSKRLLVVGDGKSCYGVVIAWDTGTSVGTITGPTKRLLSCDYKQTRPYAAVVCGEDMHCNQFHGPPFKFTATFTNHTSFVNCIRYSPNGEQVASCGQDGKIVVYNSNDMTDCFELIHVKEKAHEGGVYSISWSDDNKYIFSVSADRTCKIWNIVDKKCETIFNMGKGIGNQQLGGIWAHGFLISVSLSGKINILNKQDPEKPIRTIWGHNKSVVCMVASQDQQKLFTNCWNIKNGDCEMIENSLFKSQVSTMSVYNNTLVAAGYDDKIGSIDINCLKFKDIPLIPTPSQPQKIVLAKENIIIVGCISEIAVIYNNGFLCSIKTDYEVKALEVFNISDEKFTILAGGSTKMVHFYELDCKNKSINHDSSKTPINIIHEISAIKISPNFKYFAVCTTNKLTVVFDFNTLKSVAQWNSHANRVTCATWRHDSEYLATCGVDGNINILSINDEYWKIEYRNAHLATTIPSIIWLKDDILASVSQQDYCIKLWKVSI